MSKPTLRRPMRENFHIIIAGEQQKTRSFQVSKKKVITFAAITISIVIAIACTGIFTTGLFAHNTYLTANMKVTAKQTDELKQENRELRRQLASLTQKSEHDIAELKVQNKLLVTQMELESSKKIAKLEKLNLQQRMSFKEERDLLLSTAINELNSRSEFIENVISNIGIKIKSTSNKDAAKNSGGPFIAAEDAQYDNLIYKVDGYLKTIQTLPLGKPANGSVSSWYGKREDPINGKKAFHAGIDFRGRTGDPVLATADGRIVFAGNNGGFGKFVKIDHGNGYTTSYAHLHNYHVKKGDYITRGQTIGLIGNSGRSTGTHLHYEIAYKDKSVNPSKFMKVASLTCNFN